MKNVEQYIKNPEKALRMLAWPIILGMLIQIIYNLTDTAFVGRIGVEALAAITFSFPLFFILMALANLVASGATALIAQSIGAKKREEACRIATKAIVLSVFIALGVTIFGLLTLKKGFILLGAEQKVIELGILYMAPILAASIFAFLSSTYSAILNAQGKTKIPAIVRAISVFLNLGMDYVFIFIFSWGIFGASVATALSIVFEAIAFFIIIKNYEVTPKFKYWSFDLSLVRKIVFIGGPASLAQLIMAFSWTFFNRIFAGFGTEMVAAYGLIGRLDSVLFMPLMGLSIALMTLVGMFYGAKEYDLITRLVKSAIKYGLFLAIPLGFLFWAFPELGLRVLTNDPNVISLAIPLLRVEVFAYPIMVIGFLLGRSLMGLGYGMPSLVITSVRLILVAVPLAWFFTSVLGYGPRSVILAMVLAGVVSVVIAIIWFRVKIMKIKRV
ncbi:MATE family efflux transporter [Nanoarchaeota archaeon]